MSVLQGLPDLGAPLGSGYAAFDRFGLALAVPDTLELERSPDGAAALLVALERGHDLGLTGRLEIGFAAVCASPPTCPSAGAIGVAPADIREGVLEVASRLGPVTREWLVPPLVLAPDEVARARVVTVLDPRAAALASRLVADATLPVTAAVRLALRAVAVRMPFDVRFDPREVARRLASACGAEASVTLAELGAELDRILGGGEPGDGGDGLSDEAVRRETLALRLADVVATPEPGASLAYRLRPVAEVASGQMHVDLREPAAVIVHRLLTLDPFAAARALAGGSLDPYVRRVTVPDLPTGHTPITVTANLPEPIEGMPALYADLRMPPAPPKRPHQVSASVRLTPPGRTGTTMLILAPGEAVHGEVRLRALVASPTGVEELAGAWQPAEARYLVLSRAAFPLPLTVLRASRALLDLATGAVLTASGRTVGRLDAATGSVTVPEHPDDPLDRVVLTPLGPGRTIELPLGGARRVDLDPAVLPGFGGHRARLRTRHPPVTVGWFAEGSADSVGAVPLTAERMEAEIGWVAVSPFRPGVVWRVVRDGVPGAWSAPVPPGQGLVIDVDEQRPTPGPVPGPIEVDGLELVPEPGEPTVWTYLPPGPFLERDRQGRPSIGLLEAGDVAFLQVTTRLDLPAAARAALLSRLVGRVSATEVRPAPVEVHRVAVQARSDDGEWHTVAEGGGSGLPPWTTALSATLTPDQTAAVKAALRGARDRLRAVAELTGRGRPGRARRTQTRDVADLLKTD